MATYVSILRGINVSGRNKVPMAQLKALYEELGFRQVETYIQSGNVVFEAGAAKGLQQRIEAAIRDTFGFDVPVIVRTKKEWTAVIADNPFEARAAADPAKVHVTFLEQAPDKALWDQLDVPRFLPDEAVLKGAAVYLHIPDSYGHTKLSNAFLEQKLRVKATTRNWKTVLQLGEMMA